MIHSPTARMRNEQKTRGLSGNGCTVVANHDYPIGVSVMPIEFAFILFGSIGIVAVYFWLQDLKNKGR